MRDLKDVYAKKGDKEREGWAFRKAIATGKVDIRFNDTDDPEEIRKMIDEWNKKNKSG